MAYGEKRDFEDWLTSTYPNLGKKVAILIVETCDEIAKPSADHSPSHDYRIGKLVGVLAALEATGILTSDERLIIRNELFNGRFSYLIGRYSNDDKEECPAGGQDTQTDYRQLAQTLADLGMIFYTITPT